MQRLVKHAAEVDKSIDANSLSFDNIVKAIRVVQDEMGITGATALEAGRTISGSVGAMKSAWTNLVTGFADKNADLEGLINDLVTTIVGDGTENNLGVIGNVLPAIETALGGIAKLIEGAAPKIIEILPGLVDRVVPSLITAATDMVNAVIAVLPDLLNTVVNALIQNAPALITAAIGLVQSLIQGIQDNYQILVDGAIQIVTQLATGIIEMLPKIVALGLDLIVSLASGITESIPKLVPSIVQIIKDIAKTLTDPETLSNIFNASLDIIMALADGIVDVLPELVAATAEIIIALCNFLLDPENLDKIVDVSIDLVVTIAETLVKAAGELIGATAELINVIVNRFRETDWKQIGRDIVNGLLDGLKEMWGRLEIWFDQQWNGLVGGVKNLLDIHSPSKVFAEIGKNMALGVGVGWNDAYKGINDSIVGSFGQTMSGARDASIMESMTLNVYGARQTPAEIYRDAVAERERMKFLGVLA